MSGDCVSGEAIEEYLNRLDSRACIYSLFETELRIPEFHLHVCCVSRSEIGPLRSLLGEGINPKIINLSTGAQLHRKVPKSPKTTAQTNGPKGAQTPTSAARGSSCPVNPLI